MSVPHKKHPAYHMFPVLRHYFPYTHTHPHTHTPTHTYTYRFHKIGLLVLFVQDIGDVTLELAKTVLYFKDRGGKEYYWPEAGSDKSKEADRARPWMLLNCTRSNPNQPYIFCSVRVCYWNCHFQINPTFSAMLEFATGIVIFLI